MYISPMNQLGFHNFQMLIFHDQKSLSLNFTINYVSLHHCLSTKILVEYIFLEYLFVSFDLLWKQKWSREVFYKKVVLNNFANFTGKHLRWSLFLIELQVLGHFEEHL